MSYRHRCSLKTAGLPGGTRTHNPQLRRLVLYPVELRAVPVASRLVGVERFELPTSCSQSKRATGLRYTPKWAQIIPRAAVSGNARHGASDLLATDGDFCYKAPFLFAS